MRYEYICPFCNANLDPGEKCDCRERKQQAPVIPKKIEYPKERRKRVS